MTERVVQAGDIEMWTEDFGDPDDPTVVLIGAVGGPGVLWPDDLCEDLAEAGRHVIRFDHRDSGRSTKVDFVTNPYTLSELAADIVGMLDAYSVAAAHLVGFSMGGMIAQTVAIEHPGRVASVTSIGSTPLGRACTTATFRGEAVDGLPGTEQKVIDTLMRSFEPVSDDEEYLDRAAGVARAFTGVLEPLDEEEVRDLWKRALVHTGGIGAGATLNGVKALAASPDRTDALATVTAPTLVVHGTADPALPLPHGEATAKAIPGARLLAIDGMGHDFPHVARPRIVAAILEHTLSAERAGRRIKLGVVLPWDEDPKRLIELARYAEEIGIDSVWVPDGFADGHPATFTMMSAIAVSTDRVEVGAYMLNASVYDPALLARAALTLERLAPGRIRTILGTGWDRRDYEALGQEFPSPAVRGERTQAALEMLKRETRISVEVAGVLDDVLKLAASEADGWALSADALDAYFERVTFLRRACSETGRAFDELRLSCTFPCVDAAAERIADLAAHDMDEFRFVMDGTDDLQRLERFVETLRSQVSRPTPALPGARR